MTPGSAPRDHWADRIVDEVDRQGRPPVISTGISPSGEIHIGNLREVLTADAIYRAFRDRGIGAHFNYVSDNFDPLRRIYPFLDARAYEGLIGKPLSEIPCPCRLHASYAEHFLEPFLGALRELHVQVELERADLLYKSGRMNGVVLDALDRTADIARILKDHTGKAVDADWSPFNPLCPECGRITQARVTGWSRDRETVDYECRCGSSGTLPLPGAGKLTWRVDWPARWKVLGVTVEPFGKDHATRGGSYDTGAPIVREVFAGEPPIPVPYEWISLKGRGDMSSSKGNVLSVSKALELVPPEVLRYLVLKERPERSITFDPGVPLLRLADEVDDATVDGRAERALELSQAAGFEPVGVPFKHLVMVAQAARFDLDAVMKALGRTGYPDLSRDAVGKRLTFARRWLDGFAPEDLRFEVSPELPEVARGLTGDAARFLSRLADGLRPGMDGQAVHLLVYDLAKEFTVTSPAELFQAIYLALLGKPRGPRAGWFIALLGSEFCAARFREASEASR